MCSRCHVDGRATRVRTVTEYWPAPPEVKNKRTNDIVILIILKALGEIQEGVYFGFADA
jgi:hypothetical protein